MRNLAAAMFVGALLLAPAAVRGGESKAKPACPSLSGEWTGDFDGTYEGEWRATFTQSGSNVSATAAITVESGQRLEAEGSAGVKCVGGRTEIAGSGSAHGKSGSFSGVSDETGSKLSGTWWSGDLFGTWRGERAADEP